MVNKLFSTLASFYFDDFCLQSSTDNHVSFHVVSTLMELLYTGKRASILVTHGATQILLAALGIASRAHPVSEELMLALHHVLSKIGPKGLHLLLLCSEHYMNA